MVLDMVSLSPPPVGPFNAAAAAAAPAKLLQSCPTLCDSIDGSPPGSPIPGILQARTLEWVSISFSKAGKWKVKVKSFSRVWLFVIPWTAALQAPPSMGVSRQEYWSGVPLPSLLLTLLTGIVNCPHLLLFGLSSGSFQCLLPFAAILFTSLCIDFSSAP